MIAHSTSLETGHLERFDRVHELCRDTAALIVRVDVDRAYGLTVQASRSDDSSWSNSTLFCGSVARLLINAQSTASVPSFSKYACTSCIAAPPIEHLPTIIVVLLGLAEQILKHRIATRT